jgi:hypothetical protein
MNDLRYKLNCTLVVSLMLALLVFAGDLILKYAQPAEQWTVALPVGNGRCAPWFTAASPTNICNSMSHAVVGAVPTGSS